MVGMNRSGGFISLLILLVLSFLTWQGVQAFYKLSSQERMAVYEAQKTKAAYLADSGLDWAMAALSNNSDWKGGRLNLTNGEVVVEVIQYDKRFRITARAQSGYAKQNRIGEVSINAEGRLILTDYKVLYD